MNTMTLQTLREEMKNRWNTEIRPLLTDYEASDVLTRDVELQPPIYCKSVVENGHTVDYGLCGNCGNKFRIGNGERRIVRPVYCVCHVCGNSSMKSTYSFFSRSDKYIHFTKSYSTDEHTEFIIYDVTFEPGEVVHPRKRAENVQLCSFTKKLGLRFYDAVDQTTYTTKSSNAVYCASVFSKAIPLTDDDKKQYDKLQNLISEYDKTKEEKQKERKDKVKAKDDVRTKAELTPKEKILEAAILPHLACTKTATNNKIIDAYLYCGTNKVECVALTDNNTIRSCPICGKPLPVGYYISNNNSIEFTRHPFPYHGVWYETCMAEDGRAYLTQRVFDVNCKTNINSKEKFDISLEETYRAYFGGGKMYAYESSSDGSFTKVSPGKISNSLKYTTPYPMQTDEQIRETVGESEFATCGFVEAVAEGVTNYGELGTKSYLYSYLKNNRIEQLVKANMTNLAKSMVQDLPVPVNENETKLNKILGLSKGKLSYLQKINPDLDVFIWFKRLIDEDPEMTTETFDKMLAFQNTSINQTANSLIDCHRNYGIPINKAVDYISNVKDYQCIPEKETIVLWGDYLTMASAMDYDLSDKSRLFPSSLKLSHDKASFAYEVVKDELQEKQFALRVPGMKAMEYKDEELGMQIVAPKTPEDVISEGTNLHHCVASYVNSIANGNTKILFVRNNAAPDTSFFTIEVRDDSIRQVRGNCNCAPPYNVVGFLRKWAKKEGIVYNR